MMTMLLLDDATCETITSWKLCINRIRRKSVTLSSYLSRAFVFNYVEANSTLRMV